MSVLALTALLGAVLPPVMAHDGHEYAPALQPAAQAESLRLPGRIVIDASHDLRISASQDGTITLAPGDSIAPGRTVKKGQVLARLRPALSQPDRRDLSIEQVGSTRDVAVGRKQVERFNIDGSAPFDIKLPTPTLQMLADYRGAQVREAQITRVLDGDIAITAPFDGVLLHTRVRSGGVVVAGQPLFELRSNAGLAVVVEYSDADIDSAAATRLTTLDRRDLAMQFIGESYDPMLRSRRAVYALPPGSAGIVPGEPVTVLVPRLPLLASAALPQ